MDIPALGETVHLKEHTVHIRTPKHADVRQANRAAIIWNTTGMGPPTSRDEETFRYAMLMLTIDHWKSSETEISQTDYEKTFEKLSFDDQQTLLQAADKLRLPESIRTLLKLAEQKASQQIQSSTISDSPTSVNPSESKSD